MGVNKKYFPFLIVYISVLALFTVSTLKVQVSHLENDKSELIAERNLLEKKFNILNDVYLNKNDLCKKD